VAFINNYYFLSAWVFTVNQQDGKSNTEHNPETFKFVQAAESKWHNNERQ
jgi:hypothetical protein